MTSPVAFPDVDGLFLIDGEAGADCLVCESCGRVATVHGVRADSAAADATGASGMRVVGVCRRCSTGAIRRRLGRARWSACVLFSVAAPALGYALSHPHGAARVLLYCHL